MSADTALMPIPGPIDPVPVARPSTPRADGRVELVGLSRDSIRAALETALGSSVARPSRAAWEQVIAALPKAEATARLRGGRPHAPASVLEDMRRPDLSSPDLQVRADELHVRSGERLFPAWDALGASLEGALSELSRLVR